MVASNLIDVGTLYGRQVYLFHQKLQWWCDRFREMKVDCI